MFQFLSDLPDMQLLVNRLNFKICCSLENICVTWQNTRGSLLDTLTWKNVLKNSLSLSLSLFVSLSAPTTVSSSVSHIPSSSSLLSPWLLNRVVVCFGRGSISNSLTFLFCSTSGFKRAHSVTPNKLKLLLPEAQWLSDA